MFALHFITCSEIHVRTQRKPFERIKLSTLMVTMTSSTILNNSLSFSRMKSYIRSSGLHETLSFPRIKLRKNFSLSL